MAEEFIEDIYKRSRTIINVKRIEETLRNRRYRLLIEQWGDLIESVAEFCRDTTQQNETLGIEIWNVFQTIKDEIEEAHYVKAADLIEDVIPLMLDAMKAWNTIDVVEGVYRLFSSKSGFLNIELGNNGTPVYSLNNPAWDRYMLAKSLYIPTMKHFLVIGCGLGYLPWQMYKVANAGIDVYIFDIDNTMIEFAKNYGVLSYIPEEKLHVVIEKNFIELVVKISELIDEYNESEMIFYIENYFSYYLSEREKSTLYSLETSIQTKLNFGKLVEQNYYRNRAAVSKNLYDIDFKDFETKWIVVGGGPSFDYNVEYLRSQQGKKTIIAASTILGRMLDNGIVPDFISVIDPQERTFGHMKNITENKPVMIMAEYAHWKFAENYTGEKYLASCETAYYANWNRKEEVLKFKGTVTSFSIEIAAYAKADSIELIGMDLSFPNGHSHAIGTMDCKIVDYSKMKKVKSIDGGEVYTDAVFGMYITDIEEQIKRHPHIKFYNLSKHGALIKGCHNGQI